ncbi:MAG: sulfotransferase, partial [Sphingomicrobium sp.]
VMLVRALVDAGRAREALDAAIAPAGHSPAELALWHARAEAADAAGEAAVAAVAWGQLCAARPGDWRAWSNYGQALALNAQWREAVEALQRGLDLNPSETPLRRNLASALAHTGRHAESLTQFEQLAAEQPDDAAVHLTLSRLLADLGRNEESIAALDRAAELAVGSTSGAAGVRLIDVALRSSTASAGDAAAVDSVREMSLLLERTNRIDALRTLLDEAEQAGIAREQLGYAAAAVALRDRDPAAAKRLLGVGQPGTDAMRWHRLMAKIEDALGNPAAAFAEAEAMNRAPDDHAGWRARGADYRRRLRRLAALATPAWGAALPTAVPDGRRSPAFLVGFPRSGTTLLDTFLMGHPDVAVLEEVHLLGEAEKIIGPVLDLARRSPDDLAAARRAYFAELDRHVASDFTGLVIDKMPLNMLGLPLIYSLFPDARIIFAQRHPADAVLSGFMQSFVLNDAMASFLEISDAADLYDAAMSAFTRGREAVPLAVHTVVYEELVSDPEAAVRQLAAFLGLEWRGEMLDHQATAKGRGAIITPSYDQVVQPLSKAPSGRWRRYAEQLTLVLPVLLPWAERLGYPNELVEFPN